jgi:aspartate oxidase
LQRRAWAALGLERDGAGLAGLERWLDGCRATAPAHPRDRAAAEDRNLLDVAWAMAVSARFREESRGSHYRLDFPRPDDRFLGHTLLVDAAPRLVDVETPIPEGAPC